MNYELLAPAGDMERLLTALRFGADAVYCGGPKLQLRAQNTGFSLEGLRTAAQAVHAQGKKLYATVNAYAYNDEIDALPEYGAALVEAGIDAAIVSDLGAVATLRRYVPALPIHVSTQANCTNYASARVYADMGAERIVLARELTLDSVRTLRQKLDPSVELEAFVHGAMCMSYSGRCMISAYLTGRSANRGACAQSCRWTYHLVEEKRPGMYFPVEEDEHGMTILSSCDLNCLSFLDQIMSAGVASFKLEGRMKTPYYVATCVNAYRKRIDAILSGNASEAHTALLQRELDAASHRPYSTGFWFGELRHRAGDPGPYLQDCVFTGVVTSPVKNGRVTFELRNKLREGDTVELLSPNSLGLSFPAEHITEEDGTPVSAASVPTRLYQMDCPVDAAAGDLLRVRVSQS